MIRLIVRAALIVTALASIAPGLALAGNVETTYRPGDGIFFADPGNNFALNFGLYAQFSFEQSKTDVYRRPIDDQSGIDLVPVENIGETRRSFFARRMRLFAKGKLFQPWISFKVEVDAVANDRGIRRERATYSPLAPIEVVGVSEREQDRDYRTLKLLDYYVDLAPYSYAKFRIGQFKIPFGHQVLVSDSQLQMNGRSIASDFFTPGRDRGVMVYGTTESGEIGYAAGVFNGTGLDQGRNLDPQPAYALRFVSSDGPYRETESTLDDPRSFHAQGYFSYYSSRNHLFPDTLGQTIYDLRDTRQAAGVQLFWRHANLMAEAFTRKLEIDESLTSGSALLGNGCIAAYSFKRLSCEARGLSVQGGVYLGESSEVAARYAKVDDDKDAKNDERTELTVAYTRFFRGHALRWTTSFSNEKLGYSALGSSGFDLQVGRYPSSNTSTTVLLLEHPGFWPGLADDKNKTIVTMLQWSP